MSVGRCGAVAAAWRLWILRDVVARGKCRYGCCHFSQWNPSSEARFFFSEELDIFLSVPSAEAPAVFSIGQHVMGSASPFITRSLALP